MKQNNIDIFSKAINAAINERTARLEWHGNHNPAKAFAADLRGLDSISDYDVVSFADGYDNIYARDIELYCTDPILGDYLSEIGVDKGKTANLDQLKAAAIAWDSENAIYSYIVDLYTIGCLYALKRFANDLDDLQPNEIEDLIDMVIDAAKLQGYFNTDHPFADVVQTAIEEFRNGRAA